MLFRKIFYAIMCKRSPSSLQALTLKRFTNRISGLRKDWNGQMLTIRTNDLQFLAMLLNENESETLDWLVEKELITV